MTNQKPLFLFSAGNWRGEERANVTPLIGEPYSPEPEKQATSTPSCGLSGFSDFNFDAQPSGECRLD